MFGSRIESVLKESSCNVYTGHAQATLSLLAPSSAKWDSQNWPQNVVSMRWKLQLTQSLMSRRGRARLHNNSKGQDLRCYTCMSLRQAASECLALSLTWLWELLDHSAWLQSSGTIENTSRQIPCFTVLFCLVLKTVACSYEIQFQTALLIKKVSAILSPCYLLHNYLQGYTEEHLCKSKKKKTRKKRGNELASSWEQSKKSHPPSNNP